MKINPNAITAVRIIGTFCMLFTTPFSDAFYIIYTLSGISDGLDGFVARKTNQTTEFGAKLDSAADLMFYGIMVYRLLPILSELLPVGIWYTLTGIVILRVFTYVFTAIKYKEFMSNHTYFNKMTGLCAFSVPYFVKFHGVLMGICTLTCVICVVASIYDCILAFKHK